MRRAADFCCATPLHVVVVSVRSEKTPHVRFELRRCMRCEAFDERIEHAFNSVPLVGRFFEHLGELRDEAYKRAYASS